MKKGTTAMRTLFRFLEFCLGLLTGFGMLWLIALGAVHFLGLRPYSSEIFALMFFVSLGLGLLVYAGIRLRLLKPAGLGVATATIEDETRIIQEIHQGLSRMDERVEALETILIERSRDRETADMY